MSADENVAALANKLAYAEGTAAKYVEDAPHLVHESLRNFYARLVEQVFNDARRHSSVPRILDLGAGEGLATLPLLQLGAHVTAVDISPSQLESLRLRSENFHEQLTLRCEDISDTLNNTNETYDAITCISFLHHIPDYLGMIEKAQSLLKPHGQFFSFQDPLRYDSVGSLSRTFSEAAYISWRLRQPGAWGGIGRRLRRYRGIYHAESVEDNAEYHVTRNGVDQDAIAQTLTSKGFTCSIIPYFSTYHRILQRIGERAGVRNTFAVVARKAAA